MDLASVSRKSVSVWQARAHCGFGWGMMAQAKLEEHQGCREAAGPAQWMLYPCQQLPRISPAKIWPILHHRGWKFKKQKIFFFFFYERCSPSPLNIITARCLGDYFNGDKKYSCMGRKMVRRGRTTRIQRNVFSCPPPFPQPPNSVIFSSSPFVRAHFPCKEIKSAQLQFMQQGDTWVSGMESAQSIMCNVNPLWKYPRSTLQNDSIKWQNNMHALIRK